MPSEKPEFLKNASPEMREELQDIINKMRNGGMMDLNGLIHEFSTKLLSNLTSGLTESVDISEFSPEQIIELKTALSAMLEQIGQSTEIDDQILKFLLQSLIIGISNPEKRKEKEIAIIAEKELKELKELLERARIYEAHKVLNPKQLAGETPRDNAINNLKTGGVELASKHEGSELLTKSFVERLGNGGKGGSGMGM